MKPLYHAKIIFLLCLFSDVYGGDASSLLSQTPIQTEENSGVFLSCYSASDPINGFMFWILNGKENGVKVFDNPCRADTYPLNRTDRYILDCSDIHNISLKIRTVDRQQHGDTWQCRIGFLPSNVVTIYVKVPVEKIEITSTDKGFIPENKTSTFTCQSSFSRPKAEIYWFLSKGTPYLTTDEHLNANINETLVNITVGNRTNNVLTSTESELALKVQRSMNKQKIYCLTNYTSGRVLKSTLKSLNISYPTDGPPYVRSLGNNATYSIINKFQGNLSCIVTGGNPLPILNWICLQNGTETSWRSNITVVNEFIWAASLDNNKVKCTCQSLYLGGQSSVSVSIKVLYPPSLPEFSIQSKNGKWLTVSSEINVKENNSLTIVCNVLSNPVSTFSWTGPKSSNNKILELNVTNDSIEGSYTCRATNIMTQTNGTSLEGMKNNSIRVNVLCPPLPEKDLNFNVTTLKYVPATLRFKAMDYLDSNITTFTWQRENKASQWVTVKHDTKGVKVSTFNLQTNLTVVNVTEHYSGNYRVVYNNSVGGNTQMFQLSVADLPDTPTFFDYLKDFLTSTQVTVVWTKGYGGGLRQTFVINISQRSQPIKYDYINETENEDMQHTITGLSSGTQYKLTLWATNVLGKSLSQTLTIFTKESEPKETSSLTATIAGSVFGLAAIIAGVSVVFLLYKRRYQKKTDRSNGGRSFDDDSEMNARSGRNNPVKREPVYEGLKAINERGYVEMKEQTYDILKYKQDSSETKDPVYTNLKL